MSEELYYTNSKKLLRMIYVGDYPHFKLDAAQKANFEESIAQRIGGFTKRDEFAMQLNHPALKVQGLMTD